MCAMPHPLRHIDNITLIGEEDRQGTDLIFDLAFQNEPELARHFVKVPLVLRIVGLWIPANDIRESAIVVNERTGGILPLGDHAVEVQEWFIPGVIVLLSADA